MAVELFTYKQLDDVLAELGFSCRNVTGPKNRTWLFYQHIDSESEIVLRKK